MANDNEILLGGRDIEVTKNDGSKSSLKVKKVSHLKGGTLVSSYGDDVAFARLVTGLDDKQLAEISEDSFYDIVDVGHELNQKTLDRALRSQGKKLKNPAYQGVFQQASTLISSPGESPETSSTKPAPNS